MSYSPTEKSMVDEILCLLQPWSKKLMDANFLFWWDLKFADCFVGFVEWKPTLWKFHIQRNIKLAWDQIQTANAHFTFYSKCSNNSFPEKHETSMMQDIYIAIKKPTRNLIDSHNTATDLLSSVTVQIKVLKHSCFTIYICPPQIKINIYLQYKCLNHFGSKHFWRQIYREIFKGKITD